jgi:hypothetical protein
MSGFTIVGALVERTLPGALFADLTGSKQFAPKRREYEAAVQTFAIEASPAGISASVAAARRYGFKMTRTEAREAAVDGLRESLAALGYSEAEIGWHAARRGRRDVSLFASDAHALSSIIKKSPQMGRWRGPYTKRAH